MLPVWKKKIHCRCYHIFFWPPEYALKSKCNKISIKWYKLIMNMKYNIKRFITLKMIWKAQFVKQYCVNLHIEKNCHLTSLLQLACDRFYSLMRPEVSFLAIIELEGLISVYSRSRLMGGLWKDCPLATCFLATGLSLKIQKNQVHYRDQINAQLQQKQVHLLNTDFNDCANYYFVFNNYKNETGWFVAIYFHFNMK